MAGPIVASLAAEAGDVFNNPYFQGVSGGAVIIALGYLGYKVLRLGSEQMLLANKQALVLVEPLRREVADLERKVDECESKSDAQRAASEAERMWHQILVSRLEHIIRREGIPIPEETWMRP